MFTSNTGEGEGRSYDQRLTHIHLQWFAYSVQYHKKRYGRSITFFALIAGRRRGAVYPGTRGGVATLKPHSKSRTMHHCDALHRSYWFALTAANDSDIFTMTAILYTPAIETAQTKSRLATPAAHTVHPNYSSALSIVGVGFVSRCFRVSQLTAHNMGVIVIPAIVTDCTPPASATQ